MRVPIDPYGLERFASDVAGQMKTSTLLYFVELLEKHADRRCAMLSPEQRWLEDRGIWPRYGWPQHSSYGQ